ncbi:MAG: PIN/TRAM domain-containing protein [Planctomycetota bacterium]|nr:MAG: PIN/TRAM domain-containing protein [Planctomycetota bacterium]
MARVIIRTLFALVCIGLGYTFFPAIRGSGESAVFANAGLAGAIYGLAVALLIIALELLFAKKFIQSVPVIMISLIFGFIVAKLFVDAMFLVPAIKTAAEQDLVLNSALNLIVVFVFTYLSVIVIFRTKDEWKFIIPYVEFRRTQRGAKPLILDTSCLIDGRIADILATGAVDNQVVIPAFVMREAQAVADSKDRLKRRRGRRGLDILNKIRQNPDIEVILHEAHYGSVSRVDEKLIRMARDLDGKIVTTDFNLIKVAAVQGIPVINLNDLAEALKPVIIPGEEMSLQLIRPGEESGQAVGYLDDGTMVVVDDAHDFIGKTAEITITSIHQSSAGKMFFGRIKGRERNDGRKRK